MPATSAPELSRFYPKVLSKLLSQGLLDRSMSVLVVCGGRLDRDALLETGFTNVTISNLDDRLAADAFAPFAFRLEDAERLSCDDGQFDLALVHSGLHHCRSPHRALLEMYRVCRRGLLAIEARDNLLLRCMSRWIPAMQAEFVSVANHGWTHGGVADSGIPNYVHRWTPREVIKTISTNAPEFRHRCRFFSDLDIPYGVLRTGGVVLSAGVRCLHPLLWLGVKLFPALGNRFAFYVPKPVCPEDLQPWMKLQDGRLVVDRQWVAQRLSK